MAQTSFYKVTSQGIMFKEVVQPACNINLNGTMVRIKEIARFGLLILNDQEKAAFISAYQLGQVREEFVVSNKVILAKPGENKPEGMYEALLDYRYFHHTLEPVQWAYQPKSTYHQYGAGGQYNGAMQQQNAMLMQQLQQLQQQMQQMQQAPQQMQQMQQMQQAPQQQVPVHQDLSKNPFYNGALNNPAQAPVAQTPITTPQEMRQSLAQFEAAAMSQIPAPPTQNVQKPEEALASSINSNVPF